MRLAIASVALATGLTLAQSASAAEVGANVHERQLDNGLNMVVKEDHRAPVVVSQVWYRVGAADEHSGITGLSHVLEHMMFKGTEEYPAGRFSEIVGKAGGRENAFTSRDYTAYFEKLEKSRLETSFELEADRMRNLVLDEQSFRKELAVVKEERRLRTDDKPQALTYEQLNAAAYTNGPYHNPVIGWMEDLDSMELGDLRQWYDTWYAPNNATLVVVGDVDAKAVFKLAERYFGPLESRPLPERKPRIEAPQRGPREVTVRVPAELPYIIIGYKVPVLRAEGDANWEAYALDVLAGVLDGGRSARLSRHLVRDKELAANAGAGYDPYGRYKGLFLLDATPAAGHDVEEVEAALDSEIDSLRQELISAQELDRVKAQVLADDVYQLDSVMSQAIRIGMLETIGLGWQVMKDYVDGIQAVTAEQVRQVARKYLVDRHKSVAMLDPLPIEQARAPAGDAEAPAGEQGGPAR